MQVVSSLGSKTSSFGVKSDRISEPSQTFLRGDCWHSYSWESSSGSETRYELSYHLQWAHWACLGCLCYSIPALYSCSTLSGSSSTSTHHSVYLLMMRTHTVSPAYCSKRFLPCWTACFERLISMFASWTFERLATWSFYATLLLTCFENQSFDQMILIWLPNSNLKSLSF